MKNLKKFQEFIKENNSEKHLLYYSFDFDDNILNMPTVIHMDKKVGDKWIPEDVSTSEFAEVRGNGNYRLLNNDPDAAFSEFRDTGPRGETAFLTDVKKALSQKKFGPAWNDFIECLTNGALFSIISARGHDPIPMRTGIEYIIDNILTHDQLYSMYNHLLKFAYLFKEGDTEERILKGTPSKNKLVKLYLDNCDFIGVSSPSRGGTPEGPEKAKEEALLEFKSKINKFAQSVGMKAKVGFSDDDTKNVKHIEDLVQNLNHERFPHIKEMMVKNTKDPKNITKKVRTFESQDPLASSIMPFTSFNNSIPTGEVSGNFSPNGGENRQDTFGDRLKKQTKYLGKMSKNILGNKKRLKRKTRVKTDKLI